MMLSLFRAESRLDNARRALEKLEAIAVQMAKGTLEGEHHNWGPYRPAEARTWALVARIANRALRETADPETMTTTKEEA
jgi:hypothetical protein